MTVTCPYCRAETPEGVGVCRACSRSLAGGDAFNGSDAPTLAGSSTADTDATRLPLPDEAAGLPPTLAALLAPGRVFGGRYRIDRFLGQGGMGAVFKAWDQELDVPVALKIIRPDLIADRAASSQFEQRFKRELLLARQVTDRNVLRIHDLNEASGVKYLTMPFVEGADLHSILERGRLPFDRILKIARQLLSGLAAAHEVGVIHRDLKPQNVLVDAEDNAYISDFGLARSIEVSTSAGMTRAGEFLGTPQYLAPEQVEGKSADHRSDLYAVGLILYEMATGDVAFHGQSALEVMVQRLKTPPREPSSLNADLPAFFNRIVMRCLERDPEARYQSAADVLADLEKGRSTPSIRARTVSLTLPMPPMRSWLIGGTGVLAVLALLIAFLAPRDWIPGTATGTRSGIPPISEEMLIAVMPFRVTAGDPTPLEHIAGGLAEVLSAKLFSFPDVTVASANAVAGIDASRPPGDVARALGVNLLVAGSVLASGTRIRIVAHLDDMVGGRRLWSQEFSGLQDDLLTLQDQVFASLVDALGVVPTSEQRARAVARPTQDIAAYDLYLKGRNAMRGQQDRANVEQAVEFFESALSRDPRFALAYAGLADASLQMYRETREQLWADRALFAAEQARQVGQELAEVHLALGNVYRARGRSAEAIVELQRALELSPNSDEAYRRLGAAYMRADRAGDAIETYRKAVSTNPYYWVNHNTLGAAYLALGEYEQAAEANRRVLELEPDNVNGLNDLGAAYLYLGRFDEAAAVLQRALGVLPTSEAYTNVAIALYYSGRFAEAVPRFEEAVALNPNAEQFVGNLADGYRQAGDLEKAHETYDRAIALAFRELEVDPESAMKRYALARYYARKGDLTRAEQFLADARALDSSNVSILYGAAQLHAVARRTDEAIGALEEAFEAGYPAVLANHDPEFAEVKKDPRFGRLIERYSGRSRR
jgi:eukaryotic-like serine/threonine-protein kinase